MLSRSKVGNEPYASSSGCADQRYEEYGRRTVGSLQVLTTVDAVCSPPASSPAGVFFGASFGRRATRAPARRCIAAERTHEQSVLETFAVSISSSGRWRATNDGLPARTVSARDHRAGQRAIDAGSRRGVQSSWIASRTRAAAAPGRAGAAKFTNACWVVNRRARVGIGAAATSSARDHARCARRADGRNSRR